MTWLARALSVGLLLVLANCTPGEAPVDAGGPSGDAGEPQGYLTDDVEGWRVRCTQGQETSLEACAELLEAEGDEAERLAFVLNLEASDQGFFPPNLGELHFTHGQYSGWSVRDLSTAFDDPNRDRAELIDLARSVNRSFLDGHDAGALARWVSTPLCSSNDAVVGPESARCGNLDSECARGRFVESLGCCTAVLAPPGALCSEGVCGERGSCVPERRLRSSNRVRGRLTQFESLSGAGPWPWHLDEGTVRLSSVTDEEIASLGDSEPPDGVDYEDWEPRWAGNLGIPIAEIAEDLPGDRRIRLGLSTSGIAGTATDAPEGAETLYVTGEHQELCVIRNRSLDELGPVMSDCATGGGTLLECPGDEDDIACAHEDGNTVLRGEGLTLAFAMNSSGMLPTPTDGDPLPPPNPVPNDLLFDVIPILFPDRVCVGFQCARLLHHQPLHVVVNFQFPRRRPRFPPPPPLDLSCELGEDCRGRIHCFGLPGRPPNCLCLGRTERCNGRDDDCDGETDENSSAVCEDGVACTVDLCVDGGCSQASPDWAGAACTPAYCAQGICNGEVPSWADPTLPRTPPDANGCQLGLNHTFCENTYDQCACNGPSVCNVATARTQGPDAVTTGCAEIPSLFFPCEIFPSGDTNACTQELCCEPNPSCRHIRDPAALPLGSTTMFPLDHDLCSSSLVPRRDGAYDPGGVSVQCVSIEDFAGDDERTRMHCNDSNPCTRDFCSNQFTGQCGHRLVTRDIPPVDTTPRSEVSIAGQTILIDQGCDGELNGGCGMWRCREAGAIPPQPISCVVLPVPGTEMPGSTAPECGANNPHASCLEDFCDGAGGCVRNTPNTEHCDDPGLECAIPRCEAIIDQGFCVVDVASDWCLIGEEACVADGVFDETDPSGCRVCLAETNSRAWSQNPSDPDCNPT